MTYTPNACSHPSGLFWPDQKCEHRYESHVNCGIVLRICRLCSEPDWSTVPSEFRRIVRERMLGIAQQVTTMLNVEALSEEDQLTTQVGQILDQLRGELWEARGGSWQEIIDVALINARGRLKVLDGPPVAAVADEGGAGEVREPEGG